MKRTRSTMTPAQLRKWLGAHRLDTYTGGPALGLSRRQLMNYLAGNNPIPESVALLAAALTQLKEEERGER